MSNSLALKCRPGDLAIVIAARNVCNLGNIVHVVEPYTNQWKRYVSGCGHIWFVKASHPLTWSEGDKLIRRKEGPSPDAILQPIRGAKDPGGIWQPKELWVPH